MNIPVVWDPRTRLHEPEREVWVGVPTTGTEVPARVDAILSALEHRELVAATSHPLERLATVHEPALLDFLSGIYPAWAAGPYEELVGQDRVVPYVFPTPALTAGMEPTEAVATHGRAGEFCYDTMTLLGEHSWTAIRAAADCALTAADIVAAGTARAAYALARPPGHHVTQAGYGGSCYLNNAALAAQALREAGHATVAVVDLDAHHGNGTQAIFWSRGDVRYGSLHVDPAAGWFPHFFGHAHESGAGPGEGANLNLPLAPGTSDAVWLAGVERLAAFAESADALVVSLGVDAAAEDPESPLEITDRGYRRAGELLGALGRPAVIVQEGGYHLPSLGGLVAAYLAGHEAGT